MRNSQRLGYGENAKKHFMEVNNCNELEFASHLTSAQIAFEEKNKCLRWKIVADLKKFCDKDIAIEEKYIPIIDSKYTSEQLKKLRNECGYSPRILSIDINNYQGIITVTCDKTNKIEWYDEKHNLIETKYNFGETFITKFSVKNLYFSFVYFKLLGCFGEKISQNFNLHPYF